MEVNFQLHASSDLPLGNLRLCPLDRSLCAPEPVWLLWSFFLIRLEGGEVQLRPLGTAATDWPIVACPWWLWWWRILWNEDWQGKPKYWEKTRPSATLSTTKHTWPDPGSNPGRRGRKPAANRLSYGAALAVELRKILLIKEHTRITDMRSNIRDLV
jgi:hypothetical protein